MTRPRDAVPIGASLLAAVLFGLAAGNHSLTLLLVPPIALFVLSVEPGILRRWRFVLGLPRSRVRDGRARVPRAADPGGLVPAPLIYARPATWDGFWYIALAEQFRGSLSDPLADLADKLDTLLDLRERPARRADARHPAGVPGRRPGARRATRCSPGVALVITVAVQPGVRQRRHRRATTSARCCGSGPGSALLAAEVAQMAGLLAGGSSRGRPALTARPSVARPSSERLIVAVVAAARPAARSTSMPAARCRSLATIGMPRNGSTRRCPPCRRARSSSAGGARRRRCGTPRRSRACDPTSTSSMTGRCSTGTWAGRPTSSRASSAPDPCT